MKVVFALLLYIAINVYPSESSHGGHFRPYPCYRPQTYTYKCGPGGWSTCRGTRQVTTQCVTCGPGWQPPSECDQDIDECSANTHDCDQTCSNTEGSYTCGCQGAYELQPDGKTCILNRCSTVTICDHICTNSPPASYVCSCRDGYTLQGNGFSCPDTDECTTGEAGCEHLCTNTVGSFTCDCDPGFELQADRKSCRRDTTTTTTTPTTTTTTPTTTTTTPTTTTTTPTTTTTTPSATTTTTTSTTQTTTKTTKQPQPPRPKRGDCECNCGCEPQVVVEESCCEGKGQCDKEERDRKRERRNGKK